MTSLISALALPKRKQFILKASKITSFIYSLTTLISEDLASTSKRLGLILFRLCMVITTLKYYDRGEASTEFTCSDEDF